MNKSTYAENEESDLLQNLFNERQRVQELEEELERVHKTSKNALEIGSDQTLKFKQLVSILRKKYDEAQHKNTETREKFDKFLLDHDKLKKTYEESLHEQKQKEIQLHNVSSELKILKDQIQDLRTENQDKEEELNSLKEQLIKLKDFLQNKETYEENTKSELETYKQKQKQFERVVHYLRKRLEEAHLENKELFDTFQNTQQINKQLESSLQESNAQIVVMQNELQQLKTKQLEQEAKDNVEQNAKKEFFDEQLKLLISSKEDLEQIKDTVVLNLKEFKDEKLKSEEINLKKIEMLQKELAEVHEHKILEIQELSKSLLEWQNDSAAAKKEAEGYQKDLEAKCSELALIREELTQLANVNTGYKERLDLLEANKEESEAALRMAQQHLAKKVRETTVMAEENEELKQQNRDLQNALDFSKLKVAEYQNTLEQEYQNQKKLQEQYQEGLKSFEMHTLKWEEKYFAMQQKWQESESRLREFKNFEEKYQKMHSILNHLSNLLGKPIVLPAGELSHSFDTITIEKEKNLQIDQPTLFDLSTFSKEVKTFY